MHARSTTVVGFPSAIDAGIAYVRNRVMPVMTAMDGCVGLSLVVDRGSGRSIMTSSWESRAAMVASTGAVASMRARVGETFGGEPMVDKWEIAHMHREHLSVEAVCCRITWGRTRDVGAALSAYRDAILPQVEQADGFCSASLFLDRFSGGFCHTVRYDAPAAMRATRDPAAQWRDQLAAMAPMELGEVAEFELVLAHLRVPELV